MTTFSLVNMCNNNEKSIWQKITVKLVENGFHGFYEDCVPFRLKIIFNGE